MYLRSRGRQADKLRQEDNTREKTKWESDERLPGSYLMRPGKDGKGRDTDTEEHRYEWELFVAAKAVEDMSVRQLGLEEGDERTDDLIARPAMRAPKALPTNEGTIYDPASASERPCVREKYGAMCERNFYHLAKKKLF